MRYLVLIVLISQSFQAMARRDPAFERQMISVLDGLNGDSFKPENIGTTSLRIQTRIREICRTDAACLTRFTPVGACFKDRYDRALNSDVPNTRFSLSARTHVTQWMTAPQENSCEALLAIDDRRAPPGTGRPAPEPTPAAPEPTARPAETPARPATPETPATAASVQLRGLKAETCKWVNDLPRRLINSPGCTASTRNRICTGFVSCEQAQGGARLTRLSTCRAEHCGNGDENAVRCTQDMGYSSTRPSGETRDTVSPELNQTINRASRQ